MRVEPRGLRADQTNPSHPRASHGLIGRMFPRDQILDTLARLPARYWPVFFWDLIWVTVFHETNWAEHGGFIIFGVTKRGRIHIVGLFIHEGPDPCDWTRHAPREPWAALDPQAIAAVIEALDGEIADWTGIGLPLDDLCPADVPAVLNSS